MRDAMNDFTLDFEKWTRLFPLVGPMSERKLETTGGIGILSLWEQIRVKHLRSEGLAVVPADVFELGLGEPRRRDVTKVGGLPYRPKGIPWPTRKQCGPMTFLAQFRFAESCDLLGSLPGDILLVFVTNNHLDFYGKDSMFFCFEWYKLGLTNLIDEMPEPAWIFVTCFGVRHRTFNFLQFEKCGEILRPLIPYYFPEIDSHLVETRIEEIVTLSDMVKIGGIEDTGNIGTRGGGETRFLASLPSIHPQFGATYRWINHPEPSVEDLVPRREEILEWPQEMSSINLYLDQNSNVIPYCTASTW